MDFFLVFWECNATFRLDDDWLDLRGSGTGASGKIVHDLVNCATAKKIYLEFCYTVNFQKKIASTREVYILLDHFYKRSRPRFPFGPSEREVDHVFFLALLREKSTTFSS